MSAEFTLSRTFTFEAAHSLNLKGSTDEGYKRLHGHSFTCTLSVRGEKKDGKDWLMDFGLFDPVITGLRERLDHAYLNELDGLDAATLENLCAYIFDAAEAGLPGL